MTGKAYADRLSLATHVRKARRSTLCNQCGVQILVGQSIARLVGPPGWCHTACVPAVRKALANMGAGRAAS
jgi:hypothetical protein